MANRGLKHSVVFVFLMFALAESASAQLSRIDSVLAASLSPMVSSVSGTTAFLMGDSTLAALLSMVQQPKASSAPIFYISQLSANVRRSDSGTSRMDISMQGEVLQQMNSLATPRSLARTVNIQLTPSDWIQLQNNTDRYVHFGAPPGGFWSDTMEKVLVVVGALAVVALFFLIRS